MQPEQVHSQEDRIRRFFAHVLDYELPPLGKIHQASSPPSVGLFPLFAGWLLYSAALRDSASGESNAEPSLDRKIRAINLLREHLQEEAKAKGLNQWKQAWLKKNAYDLVKTLSSHISRLNRRIAERITESIESNSAEYHQRDVVFVSPDLAIVTLREFCEHHRSPGTLNPSVRSLARRFGCLPGCEAPWPEAKQTEGITDGPKPVMHKIRYPSRGAWFKGRDEALKQLRAAFQSKGPTPISHAQSVSGLGGVGKTRLAIEYAWTAIAQEHPWYTHIFFVSASSREGLEAGIVSIARQNLIDLPNHEIQRDDIVRARVFRWLQTNSDWLLILDGVETEDAAEAVEEMLPQLARGHVLITGRISKWSPAVIDRPLNVIGKRATQDFLLARTRDRRKRSPEDRALASELGALLGYLPLALEQAGAHISELRMSFRDYLAKWEEERKDVLKWFDPRIMQYDYSVAVTWQRTYKELSPGSQAVLHLAAFLSPHPIPLKMFEFGPNVLKRAVELEVAETGSETEDKPSVRDCLAELSAFSMIEWHEDLFTVHGLVQEVIRQRTPDETFCEWVGIALNMLYLSMPERPEEHTSWPRSLWVAPHAAPLFDLAKECGSPEPTSLLIHSLSRFFESMGSEDIAAGLLLRALAIDKYRYGRSHLRVALHLNSLAVLLTHGGRFAKAEELYRRALAIEEELSGPNHERVAAVLANLAMLLQRMDRLQEAEMLLRRALQIDEKKFGTIDRRVSLDLCRLAAILSTLNRKVEAEKTVRRALKISAEVYDRDHPGFAKVLSTLASVLHSSGRASEAERLLRQALTIDEEALGRSHPDVPADLNGLACVVYDKGSLVESEKLLRRSMAILEHHADWRGDDYQRSMRNLANILHLTDRLDEAELLMRGALDKICDLFGPDHPDSVPVLNSLGSLLVDSNRLEEACSLLQKAVSICEVSYGSNDPRIAESLGNLAALLQTAGKTEEAERCYRRVLEIEETAYGPASPRVAGVLNNLATLLSGMGRLEEALSLCRQALGINEAAYGPEHLEVSDNLGNLGSMLVSAGKAGEAEPLIRSALAIKEKTLGPQHAKVGKLVDNLGSVFFAKDQPDEAETFTCRALAIFEKSRGKEHPDFGLCLLNLAMVRKKQGRVTEAIALTRDSLRIIEAGYGREHPTVVTILNELGLLLELVGQPLEAIKSMSRALEIAERCLPPGHPNRKKVMGDLNSLLRKGG